MQEEDKYAHRLMELKKEAVLSIQAGENPRITVSKLNSYTDLNLTDNLIILKYAGEADDTKKFSKDEDDTGKFTEDEIDALIGGNN